MHCFIERMMSKDKDLRYGTPRELVEDITQQIEGFKSLSYRPDREEQSSSTVMGLVKRTESPAPGPATTRRLRPQSGVPPTTRRISKLDEYRNRRKR